MDKVFKYKNVAVGANFVGNATAFDKKLSDLGSQGWELVSVVPMQREPEFVFVYVFKRTMSAAEHDVKT